MTSYLDDEKSYIHKERGRKGEVKGKAGTTGWLGVGGGDRKVSRQRDRDRHRERQRQRREIEAKRQKDC